MALPRLALAAVISVCGACRPAPPANVSSPAGPPRSAPNAIDSQAPRAIHRTPTRSDPPEHMRAVLAEHNRVRTRVGVPELRWSAKLADVAQRWADRLARRGCDLHHRRDTPYGENLYAASGAVAPEHVVRSWADEAHDYNHARNRCRGVCGHYTQVVWARSTQLGCGSARCGDAVVWVCNYDPPGNIVGQKPYP